MIIREQELLSAHTTFRIGGPAAYYLIPENRDEVRDALVFAEEKKLPFYVLGPSSTVDLSCKTGEDIRIELRSPDEIKKKFYQAPMALEEVKCYNPAFDVTDHSLITAIITEHGICYPPYTESLARVIAG